MIAGMTARFARRCSLLVLAMAIMLAVALPGGTRAAATSGPEYGPSVVLQHLHLVKRDTGVTTTFHWRRSDGRVRQLQLIDLDPVDERVVIDQQRDMIIGNGLPSAVRDVNVIRNSTTVAPDGYDPLDVDVMSVAWPLIARVRAGGAPLVFGGAGLRKATTKLAANECAGLRAGTRTVYLDTKTFVPVRVIDRRGGTIDRDTRFAKRSGRATDFAPLKIVGKRRTYDEGYVRRTPVAASKLLAFRVSMPTALPTGFVLDHTGSAKTGNTVGPEASFPRSNGLFFAKWRRGLESIDFTIRGAKGTLAKDWDESDPFGGECSAATTSTIQVGSVTAKYAVGEEFAPRLWWRTGSTLYTLSGPFSKQQLATVAASLTPVA